MSDAQTGPSTGKVAAIVILVAIVTGVAATLLQHLLWGETKAAVTGGMVGAVTAVVAISLIKKRSS